MLQHSASPPAFPEVRDASGGSLKKRKSLQQASFLVKHPSIHAGKNMQTAPRVIRNAAVTVQGFRAARLVRCDSAEPEVTSSKTSSLVSPAVQNSNPSDCRTSEAGESSRARRRVGAILELVYLVSE